jgi:hypothetical protein
VLLLILCGMIFIYTRTAKQARDELAVANGDGGMRVDNPTFNGEQDDAGADPVRVVQVYGGGGDAMAYDAADDAAVATPTPGSSTITYAHPVDGPYDDGQYEEVGPIGGGGGSL